MLKPGLNKGEGRGRMKEAGYQKEEWERKLETEK